MNLTVDNNHIFGNIKVTTKERLYMKTKKELEDIMVVPDEFHTISEPKLRVSIAIKEGLNHKGLSIRGLGEKISMKHPQIVRVTSGENYNIDTLLKVLNGLDLEIVIQKKKL